MSNRLYDVGKIVNTHGIKGELKIVSVTDFPEDRYNKGSKLLLTHSSMSTPLPVTIESARFHKNTYIVKFKEFNNINEVEKYKNGLIKISEEQRSELEEDEFYYDEILGCEVITEQGDYVGKVTEILTTGANDVWVVKPEHGKDILIPFIDDCVREINVGDKKITVHLMEGLVE